MPPPPPQATDPAAATALSEGGTHDVPHRGFFARLWIGPGGVVVGGDDGAGNDVRISGAGVDLGVALGASLSPGLVLYGELQGSAAPNPNVEFNDVDLGEIDDSTLSIGSLGVGLSYYFMPINFYVGGGVSAGVAGLEVDGFDLETDVGPGFHLMLGKEWFVSPNWGLGIAARFLFLSLPDDAVDVTGGTLSLLFSATYN